VAVARLRSAGPIILGKTNLPTLASGIQTDDPVFGRTNNPWDLRCTPGGSSGGAAAAIAAGLSFLELGSDIGGSIRIPAHSCGVYGLKTTAGRVAGKGHIASACSASALHLAWTDDFGGTPVDHETRWAMQQLTDAMVLQGHPVERRRSATIDYEKAWWIAGICLGAINPLFQSRATRWARRLVSPVLQRIGSRHPLHRGLFAGVALDRERLRGALHDRLRMIDQLETFLESWDAWMCPVFPRPAFSHRPMNAPVDVDGQPMSQLEANLLHTIIFNLTGNPVLTIPIGSSSQGLPIGVQSRKTWPGYAAAGHREAGFFTRQWLSGADRRLRTLTSQFRRRPRYVGRQGCESEQRLSCANAVFLGDSRCNHKQRC
jgi:amidase